MTNKKIVMDYLSIKSTMYPYGFQSHTTYLDNLLSIQQVNAMKFNRKLNLWLFMRINEILRSSRYVRGIND